jgi:small-conductance mechanosensitive channel
MNCTAGANLAMLLAESTWKGIHLTDLVTEDLVKRAAVWGSKLGMSLLLFASFLLASFLADKLICRLGRRADSIKQDVLNLLGQVAKTTLIVVGTVTALGTVGVNVSAMVAGLGLTGFALGFAFRDALSNVLAGVLILVYRPFQRGDHIAVAGFEGHVARIDLRYTTLQGEAKKFLIPNSILLTNAIVLNQTSKPVQD